jgi:glycerophosphoryl diester phosphodiesterase
VSLSLLRGDGPPLRIGHRGAAALAPDNTLASFELALELGVDGIEFDVVGDSVGHDVHTTTGLSLDAALEFFAASGTVVQLDLKTRGVERDVAAALRRHDLLERTVVSSFDAATLVALADAEPRLARSFTYPNDRLGVSRRRALAPAVRAGVHALARVLPRRAGMLLERARASALTLQHVLVTRETIAACHARGAAVWAWTVNDEDEAARLAALGTDAIITDDPRILRAFSRS